jgi:hypothetical protein
LEPVAAWARDEGAAGGTRFPFALGS